MRFVKAIRTILEVMQLLGVDWINEHTRQYWHTARAEIRTLRFRAHAAIPPISLADLVSIISNEPQTEIILPPPTTKLDGVGDPIYYYTIAALSKALQPRQVLEIGTFLGVGTLTIALNTHPDCHIYTIDLPEDDNALSVASNLNATDKSLVTRSRQRVGEAFLSHAVAGKISQIRANSASIRLRDYLEGADMVFVDGGHSYDLVRKDSENALWILSYRGLILWDDYWWFYPDVVKYLDGLSKRITLRRIERTNLVVYLQGFDV